MTIPEKHAQRLLDKAESILRDLEDEGLSWNDAITIGVSLATTSLGALVREGVFEKDDIPAMWGRYLDTAMQKIGDE